MSGQQMADGGGYARLARRRGEWLVTESTAEGAEILAALKLLPPPVA